jgi:hypothetical protein
MNVMKQHAVGLAVGLALLACSALARAEEPTAFGVAREGNRYLGEQSRDKVVQIRSEKSAGGLVPTLWSVVYYDPTTTFKAVEIRFGGGAMLEIKRPARVIELVGDADKPLDRARFKVYSDKAIKIAASDHEVDRLTLRATKLWLQRGENGPVWKVRLWAAKFRRPADEADIGDIYVSAVDGRVVKSDLHLNRLE